MIKKCLYPKKTGFTWRLQLMKINNACYKDNGVPGPILRPRDKGRKPRLETRANNHTLTVLENVLVKRLLDADR